MIGNSQMESGRNLAVWSLRMYNDTSEMELVDEFVVPKCSAETFEVDEGQRFRVVAHEGAQVSDLVLINAEDETDTYAGFHTIAINQAKGIGNFDRVKELYSRAPDSKLLATITEDRVNDQQPWLEDGCSHVYHEHHGDGYDGCSENIVSALNDAGYDYSKAPNIFNFGMNFKREALPDIEFGLPEITKGDYMEFEAEMDLTAALSACPAEMNIHYFEPKSLKVLVYD